MPNLLTFWMTILRVHRARFQKVRSERVLSINKEYGAMIDDDERALVSIIIGLWGRKNYKIDNIFLIVK